MGFAHSEPTVANFSDEPAWGNDRRSAMIRQAACRELRQICGPLRITSSIPR